MDKNQRDEVRVLVREVIADKCSELAHWLQLGPGDRDNSMRWPERPLELIETSLRILALLETAAAPRFPVNVAHVYAPPVRR